jgi:hypothetical protein
MSSKRTRSPARRSAHEQPRCTAVKGHDRVRAPASRSHASSKRRRAEPGRGACPKKVKDLATRLPTPPAVTRLRSGGLRAARRRVRHLFTLSFTPARTRLGDVARSCRSSRNLRALPSAPGEIRTPDLRFRRPTLYPAELRARRDQSSCPHEDAISTRGPGAARSAHTSTVFGAPRVQLRSAWTGACPARIHPAGSGSGGTPASWCRATWKTSRAAERAPTPSRSRSMQGRLRHRRQPTRPSPLAAPLAEANKALK